MNRQIDINTKLRLALCMGNLQLKDKESFTDAQISVAQRSMKKIERFLRHTDDPEYTASELLREIHTAFKYYSNTFSVLYKISRRSTEDYSAESLFYPYKEHCLNVDQTFFDRNFYKNEEIREPDRQEVEDNKYTGIRSHGLCFVQDKRDILRYLGYGTQLTISVLDPLIFPMHKTLVRSIDLHGTQFQVSQAYISEIILLDDYRIIKQMLRQEKELDYFFMHSEYERTIKNFISSISKYPNTDDVITFMSKLKGFYLKANQERDTFLQMVDAEFPGQAYGFLFHDNEIINRERAFLGISESVEESIENLLKTC